MGISTGAPDYGRMQFAIQNQTTGFDDNYKMQTAYDIDGTWKMVWDPNRVRVYKQALGQPDANFVLMFDTDVDTGANGTLPGEWEIPTDRLGLFVHHSRPTLMTPTSERIYFGPTELPEIPECGDLGFLKSDLNNDCVVDILDITQLAQTWILSTDPCVSGHVDYSDPLTIEAPSVSATVILDGTKSVGEWDIANKYPMNGLDPGVIPGITGGGSLANLPFEVLEVNDLSADIYTMYDEDYLYIGIDVKDDSVFYGGGDVYDQDCIEVYFDFDNSDTNGYYSSNDPCLGVQLAALCISDQAYLQYDNVSNPSGATWWKAIGDLTSEGYFLEYRIDLNLSPLSTGSIFGFDIDVIDYEVGSGTISKLAYYDGNWKSEEFWGDIVLLPKLECGSKGYSDADLNKDCVVDLRDFSDIANQWLLCTSPEVDKCSQPFDCESNPDDCMK